MTSLISIGMKNNIYSYSSIYALLVFFGFFDLFTYYYNFGIQINSFMTIGEILFSFLPRTLIILPAIAVFFVIISFFNIAPSDIKIPEPNIKTSAIKMMITYFNKLPNSLSKKRNIIVYIAITIKFLLDSFMAIANWLIIFFFPIIIGWFLFFTDVSYENRFIDGAYVVFAILLSGTIFIMLFIHRNFIPFLLAYNIFIASLAFIGIDNKKKSRLILENKPNYSVSYTTKSNLITTDSCHIFIGKTEKYLFFRNLMDDSNSIVKIENIENLKMRKINYK